MSRALTSNMVSAFEGSPLRPFFLFEGSFADSTVRVWDGYGDLSWNSQTWLGNGWFRGFSDIKEDNELRAGGIDVLLSGVPLALVSLILTEARHTSRGKLYVGAFDSSRAVITDPYLLFEGGLSSPRIDDSSDEAEVILSYEDDLVVLQKSSDLRFNYDSQRAIFPADRGFEYVAGLADWTGFWGSKTKPKTKATKKDKRKKDKGSRR